MTKVDNNTLKLEDKEVFIFGITVGIDELYNNLKKSLESKLWRL